MKSKESTAKAMAEAGAQLDAVRTARLADSIQLLEERLRTLAKKHEALIRRDPYVRKQFKILADSLGIDLLESRANVFSKTLGFGDYYYELSVRVIEICIHEKQYAGGLVPLQTVLRQLQKSRPHDHISEADVVYSLEKIGVLGSGYKVVKLSDKSSYIQATPEELSTDVLTVLKVAATKGTSPVLTVKELTEAPLSWTRLRAERALDDAMKKGMAWIEYLEDDPKARSRPCAYWFLMVHPVLTPSSIGSSGVPSPTNVVASQ